MSQIEQDPRTGLLCCFSTGFWRAVREYRDSLNKACDPFRCCSRRQEKYGNSFMEIARLLSNLFRDLNVAGSDVAAGLVLLRKYQRLQRENIQEQVDNDTYQFLSGVAITPSTKFLDVNIPEVCDEIEVITHYMEFALGVYGWPMYLMTNGAGDGCGCSFIKQLRCLCCLWKRDGGLDANREIVIEDNCCLCNFAALKQMLMKNNPNVQVIYVSYHVNVNETPFMIALDHERRTVVVSVRGTLSLQDVLTDLNADGEPLPVDPPREDWIGHKGMVHAAQYIRKKLVDEELLDYAFNYSSDRGTSTYDLVLVGHSLGAGTASVLSILLKKSYPNLLCYAYSPPGGTLSISAVEYSKSFITSIILGKDVVPRIGLHQIDALRSDLINAISHSNEPKWKIIMSGMMCCTCRSEADECEQRAAVMMQERCLGGLRHSESTITLTSTEPLFPPGKIMHIVRSHPKNNLVVDTAADGNTLGGQNDKSMWRKLGFGSEEEPVYQALWAEPRDFDRVLVSPSMIQDHMPDKVLESLQKLLTKIGPTKPKRAVPHKTDVLMAVHSESIALDPLAAETTEDQLVERVKSLQRSQKVVTEAPQSSLSSLGLSLANYAAPLASPETLSEVSSVSGFCSNRRSSVIRVHSDAEVTQQYEIPMYFKAVDPSSSVSIASYSPTSNGAGEGGVTDDSVLTPATSILRSVLARPESQSSKGTPNKKVRIALDLTSDVERGVSPNGLAGGDQGWLASCSSDTPTTEDETQLTLDEQLASLHLQVKEADYDGDVDETASERSSQVAGSSILQPVRQYYYYDYYENGGDVNTPAPTESAL